jgi:pyrophosphatase PpaX
LKASRRSDFEIWEKDYQNPLIRTLFLVGILNAIPQRWIKTMATPGWKALLLDLDGTVVDTHELIFRCYDQTMRSHCGCQGSRQILEQCTGMHLRNIFSATLEHFGLPVSDRLLADAITNYRAVLRDHEASVTTFPGMKDCLGRFVELGWRLAIVTTKSRESALRHLQSQGLTTLFATVVAGDDCEKNKPHPESFLKALAALGVGSERAIGIGDSEHDIHGARAAGLKTVAACWGTLNRARLLTAKPDYCAEQPGDLLTLGL